MSYRYYNVVDLIQPFMTDDLVPLAYKKHTQTILSALSAKAISMYGHSGFDEPNILKQDADEGEPDAFSIDSGLILAHATLLSGGYAGIPEYENLYFDPLPSYTYTQKHAFFIAAFQYLCYMTEANEHIETILSEIKYTCVCDYANKYNIIMNAITALTNPKFSFIPGTMVDWYEIPPIDRFKNNKLGYMSMYPLGLTIDDGPFGVDAQEQSVATIIRNKIPVYQLPTRLQNYILNDVRLVWSKTKVAY